jgi:hypothetical protein
MQTPSSTTNTQEMNNLLNFQYTTFESEYVDLQEVKRVLDEKFAETDRMIKENEKNVAATGRQINDLFVLIGGIGNNNGAFAEDHFFSAFRKNKNFANENFDKVLRNQWIKNDQWHTEFDLLLLNGKSAAILEVKYRASHENINLSSV